jgi:hypothetical protein
MSFVFTVTAILGLVVGTSSNPVSNLDSRSVTPSVGYHDRAPVSRAMVGQPTAAQHASRYHSRQGYHRLASRYHGATTVGCLYHGSVTRPVCYHRDAHTTDISIV